NGRTPSPERFIKVCGFTNNTFSDPTKSSAYAQLNFVLLQSKLNRSINSSTTKKPTLCLVLLYFLPGFPNPIIHFILSHSLLYIILLWNDNNPFCFLDTYIEYFA